MADVNKMSSSNPFRRKMADAQTGGKNNEMSDDTAITVAGSSPAEGDAKSSSAPARGGSSQLFLAMLRLLVLGNS